ncbi:hypothetical protein [Neosynechococcus sphagnicola]|uniref:hypothetical protein n=1 Tax=Neosynechococcus sphagnicola TaxID=1501145 RepID=UPI00056C09FA|nr:hypothetical protein [Neosynechococcus sphagnicola]
MSRVRNFVLICVTVCCLAIATGVLAQKPQLPPPDYFPLPIAAVWKYKTTSDAGTNTEFTQTVLKTESQPDGTLLYLTQISSNSPQQTPIQTWYSKPPGWVMMHKMSYYLTEGSFQPVRPFLKNPLVPGTTWDWKGTGIVGEDISETSKVIALEDVVVPAGKYQAMKVITNVNQTGSPVTKTYWYANHVGLVKSVTDSNGVQATSQLVSYTFP